MGKEKAPLDPVKRFADSLREKKGLTWATAKLELQDDDAQYVDYFRGKDFARFLRADAERLSSLQAAVQALSSKAGRTLDEQVGDVMQLLLKRKLIRKADRKYKRPKPGRKRLVKYPKTLVPLQEPGWDEAAFYCWTYDRPTSVWYYVGTVALPVLVIAACLFPLAPWYVRMTLVYFLMALLTALLGLIALRYVLFAAVWIVTGHSFWLFPNLMSDEVSVLDALKPIVSYTRPGKDAKGQWLSRGATLLVVASIVYLLHGHTPDAKRLADRAKKAHDSILDYLDVYGQKSAGRLQGEGAGAGVPTEGHQGQAGGQGTGSHHQQQQYQRSNGGRGAGAGRGKDDL